MQKEEFLDGYDYLNSRLTHSLRLQKTKSSLGTVYIYIFVCWHTRMLPQQFTTLSPKGHILLLRISALENSLDIR